MISYKLPLAALGAAFFFALGWQVRPVPAPETVTKTQIQHDVEVRTQDRIVTKTVTVKERAPNGTTKETRTVETAKAQDSSKTSQVHTAKAVAQLPSDNTRPVWSLGVQVQAAQLDRFQPVAAEVGYRVGGPFWVTGSWNWQQHAALAGLRVEF